MGDRFAPCRGSINAVLAYAMVFAPAVWPLRAIADCPADFNGNGKVDGGDLGSLLGDWGAVNVCSDADFDGDGIVNGFDLGILLGNWGPCSPPTPCRDSAEYSIDRESICLARHSIPVQATVSGAIDDDASGMGDAEVAIDLGGPTVTMNCTASSQVLVDQSTGTIVDLDPRGSLDTIFVNGSPQSMSDILDLAMEEAQTLPSPSSWQPTTRVVVGMMALSETPQWACLMEANFGGEGSVAASIPWYCRTWVYSAAAFVIAAARIAGCTLFFSVCVAGVAAYPIAGFFINCVFLTVTLCVGGTIVATPAILGWLYSYLCQ